MNKDDFFDLGERYAAGKCSKQEEQLFEKLYQEFQQGDEPENDGKDLERIRLEMLWNIKKGRGKNPEKDRFKPIRSKFKMISIAAGLALLLSVNWFLGDSFLSSAQEIPMINKTTQPGQKSTLILSDGTRIWLNANTTLKYPEQFSGKERMVELQGEAFFEVQKNASMPFVVNTPRLSTRVLGTKFNVAARRNSRQTIVSLVEGSVEVTLTHHSSETESVILKPAEQIVYDQDLNSSTIESFDASKVSAWKEGRLVFDKETLQEVALQLEDWFGLEVVFAHQDLAKCRLKASFNDDSLIEVLETMKYALDIKYKVENGKIYLIGQGCK